MRRVRSSVDYVKATLLFTGLWLVGVSAVTQVEAITCWGYGHACHIVLDGEVAHHAYWS